MSIIICLESAFLDSILSMDSIINLWIYLIFQCVFVVHICQTFPDVHRKFRCVLWSLLIFSILPLKLLLCFCLKWDRGSISPGHFEKPRGINNQVLFNVKVHLYLRHGSESPLWFGLKCIEIILSGLSLKLLRVQAG